MTITCPSCGTQVGKTDKRCRNCGQIMALAVGMRTTAECPSCLRQIPKFSSICPRCQTALALGWAAAQEEKRGRLLPLEAWVGIVLFVVMVTIGLQVMSGISSLFEREEQPRTAASIARGNSQSSSNGWYTGGTLQTATLKSWSAGTPADRLASSADLAAAFLMTKPGWEERLRSMNDLRPYANLLNRCITEVSSGSGTESMTVPDVATACIVQLGWR